MKKALKNITLATIAAASILGYSTQSRAEQKSAKSYDFEDYSSILDRCMDETDYSFYTKHQEDCDRANECIVSPNAPQCVELLNKKSLQVKSNPLEQTNTTNINSNAVSAATELTGNTELTSNTKLASTIPSTSTTQLTSTTQSISPISVTPITQGVRQSKSLDELALGSSEEFQWIKDNLNEEQQEALVQLGIDVIDNTLYWTANPAIDGNAVPNPVEGAYSVMQVDPKAKVSNSKALGNYSKGNVSSIRMAELFGKLKLTPEEVTSVVLPRFVKEGIDCETDFRNSSTVKKAIGKDLSAKLKSAKECSAKFIPLGKFSYDGKDAYYGESHVGLNLTIDNKPAHEGSYIKIKTPHFLAAQWAGSNTVKDHVFIHGRSALKLDEDLLALVGLRNANEINTQNIVYQEIQDKANNQPLEILDKQYLTAHADGLTEAVARFVFKDEDPTEIKDIISDLESTINGNSITFYDNPQAVGKKRLLATIVDKHGLETEVSGIYKVIAKEQPKTEVEESPKKSTRTTNLQDFLRVGVEGNYLIGNDPKYSVGFFVDKNIGHLVVGAEAALGYSSDEILHADRVTLYEEQQTTNQGTPVLLDTPSRVERSVLSNTQNDSNLNLSIGARAGAQFSDAWGLMAGLGYERNSNTQDHEGGQTDYFNDGRTEFIGLELDQQTIDHAAYLKLQPSWTHKSGFGINANVKANTKGKYGVGAGLQYTFRGNKK